MGFSPRPFSLIGALPLDPTLSGEALRVPAASQAHTVGLSLCPTTWPRQNHAYNELCFSNLAGSTHTIQWSLTRTSLPWSGRGGVRICLTGVPASWRGRGPKPGKPVSTGRENIGWWEEDSKDLKKTFVIYHAISGHGMHNTRSTNTLEVQSWVLVNSVSENLN